MRSQAPQRRTNATARGRRSYGAKHCYKALCERTEIVRISDPKKVLHGLLLQELEKELGIPSGKVSVWMIKNKERVKPLKCDTAEFPRLRGGFACEEREDLNKAACTKKSIIWAKAFDRYIKRESTNEKKCVICIDGYGSIVVIRILNAFNPDEILSRSQFILSHSNPGWNKGCSLSGHINGEQAFKRFKANPVASKAFFGRHYEEYEALNVEITADGHGTSGRLHYKNRAGQRKKFQFGNYIQRTVYEADELEGNTYHQTASSILRSLGPYVSDPNNYLKKQPSSTMRMVMAVNHWEGGTPAPPAWHADGTVHAACLASAMPSVNSVPLDSNSKANCDAGGLCLEFGGYIHPYGHQDAIIFNGSDLHAPTCPSPDDKEKKNNGENNRVGRHSFITFITNKKEK